MKANQSAVFLGITAILVGIFIGRLTAPNPSTTLLGNPSNESMPTTPPASKPAKRSVLSTVPLQPRTNSVAHAKSDQKWREQERERKYQTVLTNWVERTALERDQEYTEVFAELGLDSSTATELKGKLTQMHHLAIAAGRPLEDLLEARVEYDRELKRLLGDENYKLYRAYEETKPARREYANIVRYAWENHNTAIPPEHFPEIVDIIASSGATRNVTWHDPYGPTPQPAVGREMVLERLNETINSYTGAISNAERLMAESGLPEELKGILGAYFSKEAAVLGEQIFQMSRPEEDFKAEMRSRVREQLELSKRPESLP